MKYVFCSSIYNMEDYEHLSGKSKVALSLADHNLNYNIIIGLDESTGSPVKLVNNVQIPSYPKYPKIFFSKQRWSHTPGTQDTNCGFINLPFFKHISRAVTTFQGIRKEVKEAKDEQVCVMTYDLRLGISIAIKLAKLVYPQIHTCVVLPDVPDAVLVASTGGNITKKARLWAAAKMQFIKQFDSYVFLTEHMKDVVDTAGKTYVVMEGIYNSHQPPLAEKTTKKKVIFYSGQLNPAYGMENLLEAFVEIYKDHKNYELWLCGGGKLVDRITALAQECPGIQYFGYVNAQRVRELQAEATVLVNPRQNTSEFTKYSFPSKTMEYLASGRPVIGYQLDGIPREYDEYIQYVEENSIESLREKLMEVCELPQEKRRAIGEKSRRFILEKKNPKIQCQKIARMVQDMAEGR